MRPTERSFVVPFHFNSNRYAVERGHEGEAGARGKSVSHPKIPPNCDYFRHGAFALFEKCDPPFPLIVVDNKCVCENTVGIISAVARCAWLDEAERISVEHDLYCCGSAENDAGKSNRGHGAFKATLLRDAALGIAEQWRLWGKGESWE